MSEPSAMNGYPCPGKPSRIVYSLCASMRTCGGARIAISASSCGAPAAAAAPSVARESETRRTAGRAASAAVARSSAAAARGLLGNREGRTSGSRSIFDV